MVSSSMFLFGPITVYTVNCILLQLSCERIGLHIWKGYSCVTGLWLPELFVYAPLSTDKYHTYIGKGGGGNASSLIIEPSMSLFGHAACTAVERCRAGAGGVRCWQVQCRQPKTCNRTAKGSNFITKSIHFAHLGILFIYAPLSAGRRVCMGESLARAELVIFN